MTDLNKRVIELQREADEAKDDAAKQEALRAAKTNVETKNKEIAKMEERVSKMKLEIQ